VSKRSAVMSKEEEEDLMSKALPTRPRSATRRARPSAAIMNSTLSHRRNSRGAACAPPRNDASRQATIIAAAATAVVVVVVMNPEVARRGVILLWRSYPRAPKL
jgi:hypothetical protein